MSAAGGLWTMMRAMRSGRWSAVIVAILAAFAFAACGAPAATTSAPTAAGAPCGITPEEMGAPIASGANYVPPAPSASASAPRSP